MHTTVDPGLAGSSSDDGVQQNGKGKVADSQPLGSPKAADDESVACLSTMTESNEILSHRMTGVKFVLVVLSSRGMVFDREALRYQILLAYPDAIIFFQAASGKPVGTHAPDQVDLLIDFTGPGQREGWFQARKLRRRARVIVGRNAGLFRKRIYDRVFDERAPSVRSQVPQEMLQRERVVQKKVLALAGVGFVQAGETPTDRSKSIALELPGMRRL